MNKPSFGLIGVGAFGALAARHLAPHFDLVLYDHSLNIGPLAREIGAHVGNMSKAASCDYVMLAVPVQKMPDILKEITPRLKPGAVVMDVSSVKMKPVAEMLELLPQNVSIVGTHPLFGPQSGKHGIAGLNMVVCDVRGGQGPCVAKFCTEKLGLRVTQVTPEEHDREAAIVQGLTHMLAKIVVGLDLPPMRFPTKTYELMQEMVEMVRYDSDDVFRAIQRENPFSNEAKTRFFAEAKKLEEQLDK